MRFRNEMNFDFAMTIGSALMLFMFMFVGKRHQLNRWKGALFVFTYAAYIVYLIQRG
jgi:cation:H+ antiporter